MSRLESVQNAAARLVTGTQRCDHITSVLPSTIRPDTGVWMPVRQRVDFKVATIMVHRSLSGNLPSYLADDCCLIADARKQRLRFTENRTCVVTRTHSSFGDRFCSCRSRTMEQFTITFSEMQTYCRFRHSSRIRFLRFFENPKNATFYVF